MIELQRGDEMALTRDDGTSLGKLTMGVGWDKKPGAGALSGSNTPDVDLDASAIQYAGEQLFDLAFVIGEEREVERDAFLAKILADSFPDRDDFRIVGNGAEEDRFGHGSLSQNRGRPVSTRPMNSRR